jgi:hypothetical protein
VSTDTEREALAAKFERHADEEGRILEQYRTLAEALGNGPAGMLVNQILTEEEIHHLLLRTMATWLREHSDALPAAAGRDVNRSELLRLTETLKHHERETIDTTRALMAQVSGASSHLLRTLLEMMVLDSEKHHRLLTTVQELLKA